MVNRNSYDLVKPLVETGNITSLQEIFKRKLVPITAFIKATGRRHTTMHDRIYNPVNMTIADCLVIAKILNLTSEQVYALALKDIELKNATAKAKPKKAASKPAPRKKA